MEKQVLGISLSPEVSQLLAENEIDLFREIKRKVQDISRADDAVQPPPAEASLKSLELLILASAAATPLVVSANYTNHRCHF